MAKENWNGNVYFKNKIDSHCQYKTKTYILELEKTNQIIKLSVNYCKIFVWNLKKLFPYPGLIAAFSKPKNQIKASFSFLITGFIFFTEN